MLHFGLFWNVLVLVIDWNSFSCLVPLWHFDLISTTLAALVKGCNYLTNCQLCVTAHSKTLCLTFGDLKSSILLVSYLAVNYLFLAVNSVLFRHCLMLQITLFTYKNISEK